jgi:hypothetical protein
LNLSGNDYTVTGPDLFELRRVIDSLQERVSDIVQLADNINVAYPDRGERSTESYNAVVGYFDVINECCVQTMDLIDEKLFEVLVNLFL